jgi:hypothetical protein
VLADFEAATRDNARLLVSEVDLIFVLFRLAVPSFRALMIFADKNISTKTLKVHSRNVC